MHTATNIEGFEINNGNAYFSTDTLTNGGVNGTTAGALARLGTGQALFQFGQGWQALPLGFGTNGRPILNPLFFVAAVTRAYVAPQFGLPANPTCLVAHCKLPGPITYVARVEVDAAGRLYLNGVLSGTPWVMVPGRYDMIELYTSQPDGLMQLWVNGGLEVSIAGAVGTIDHVQLGDERITAGGGRTFDDVFIEASRVSSAIIDLPGPGRVERFVPSVNGTDNGWTLVGAATKSLAVSEDPPNADTSYLHNGGAVNAQTLRTWTRQMTGLPASAPSACLAAGESFRAIRGSNITRRTAGTCNWNMARLRSGVVVDQTTTFTSTAGTYQMLGGKVWQNDPATGAPWIPAAVDAIEAGLAITSVGTGRTTNLYVQMERGVAFPVPARAKINPVVLGGGGKPNLINPPILGG